MNPILILFIKIVKFVCSRLAEIGTFLQGLAAMIAVALGANAFKEYRKQKRADAAVKISSQFQETIDYIIEVADKKENMQHSHINESLMVSPIAEEKHENSHPEKPPRDIYNKMNQLKSNLIEPMTHMTGPTASELSDWLNKLEKYSKTLCSAIYYTLKDHPDFQKKPDLVDALKNYRTELESIMQQVKTILNPIIEGRD